MSDNWQAADYVIKAGSTSQTIYVKIESSANSSPGLAGITGLTASMGVTASYVRQGGSRTAITLAALGAVDAAWSSGGWFEVDSTNCAGLYRLDLPDAALATGADGVVVYLVGKNGLIFKQEKVTIALPTYATLRTALFAHVIESEGSYTAQQALSIMLAVLGGVTASSGATLKTPNGNATRVSATIDSSNNRTAMSLSPSS